MHVWVHAYRTSAQPSTASITMVRTCTGAGAEPSLQPAVPGAQISIVTLLFFTDSGVCSSEMGGTAGSARSIKDSMLSQGASV